jgi:hypothetical protein
MVHRFEQVKLKQLLLMKPERKTGKILVELAPGALIDLSTESIYYLTNPQKL